MRLIDADKLEVDMTETVFCGDGTYKIFGYSKKQIDSAPTITPKPNQPLTLEKLREMAKEGEYSIGDGNSYFEPGEIKPVYLEGEICAYGSVTFDDGTPQIWWVGWDIPYKMIAEEYGKTWLAYRTKPEEGTT